MSTTNIRQKTDQNIRKQTAPNSIKKEYHAEINDLICDQLDAIGNGIIAIMPSDVILAPQENIIYQAMTAGNYTNLKNAAGTVAQLYDEAGQPVINNEVTEEDLTVGVQLQYDATSDRWTKKVQQINLQQYTPNGGYPGSAQDLNLAKLERSDVTIVANPQLFNPNNVENGEIDLTTFALGVNQLYKRTLQIEIEPSTLYNLTGLGTVHHPIPVRFEDAAGVLLSGIVSAADVSNFSFTSPAQNVKYLRFTCKTGKTGDNMVLANISLKKDGIDKATEILNTAFYSKFAVNQDKIVYIDNIGKNKFPLGKSLKGFYNQTTYVFTSNPDYRSTPLVPVPASTVMTISGLGAVHYALAIAFFKEDGTPCEQKGILSGVSVPSFTFVTPADCAYLGYTWHTTAPGDDSIEALQQLEIGSAKTDYEAPITGISKLGITQKDGSTISMPLIASAPAVPSIPSDPISLAYLNTVIGSPFLDLTGIIMGDSISTTEGGVTNWPTYAMPLLGVKPENVHNFAVSQAKWEDFATSVPRQKLSQQVADAIAMGLSPDFIVIAIGTNSLNSTNFGSYQATMAKAEADLDMSNVMDAERKLLTDLEAAFPNAKKFYGTPLQRGAFTVDEMRPKVEQFALMAMNFNWQIIDSFNKSGYTRGLLWKYSADELHPNAVFKPIYGSFFAKQLLNLYF